MNVEELGLGIALILRFEAGGSQAAYYKLGAQTPEWPGGKSGVTIGIGYDLGYHAQDELRGDWNTRLGNDVIERLAECCGVTGDDADDLTDSLSDIVVPWDRANDEFRQVSMPRYWTLTQKAFPGVENTHPNCAGGLLSLVFNRGARLADKNPATHDRLEMRQIQQLVPQRDYAGIAAQIRSMKRLWAGTGNERGMNNRRDAEAALVASAAQG